MYVMGIGGAACIMEEEEEDGGIGSNKGPSDEFNGRGMISESSDADKSECVRLREEQKLLAVRRSKDEFEELLLLLLLLVTLFFESSGKGLISKLKEVCFR